MSTFDFKVAEHEEYGGAGLQALFMRGAEPLPGMTAAHDILEHFEQLGEAIDSDGECMALGAALYVRAESGGLRGRYQNQTPGSNLSGDVARLHTDAYNWGALTDPGRTCALEEHVEEWISEAVHLAMRELRDEHEPDELPGPEWPGYVRGWLRRGYRKARKRYGSGRGVGEWTFRRLEGELDQALKHADENTESIVRVELAYNAPDSFRVYVLEPWDERHPDYEPWDDY